MRRRERIQFEPGNKDSVVPHEAEDGKKVTRAHAREGSVDVDTEDIDVVPRTDAEQAIADWEEGQTDMPKVKDRSRQAGRLMKRLLHRGQRRARGETYQVTQNERVVIDRAPTGDELHRFVLFGELPKTDTANQRVEIEQVGRDEIIDVVSKKGDTVSRRRATPEEILAYLESGEMPAYNDPAVAVSFDGEFPRYRLRVYEKELQENRFAQAKKRRTGVDTSAERELVRADKERMLNVNEDQLEDEVTPPADEDENLAA